MIVDLTHMIEAGMPVYPGDPEVTQESASTMTRDGCRVARLTLSSHTGTHMDAPAHILSQGTTLDQLPVSQFCGRAAVLDVSQLAGGVISAQFLRERCCALRPADFALFYTGWERLWGTDAFYQGGFPILDHEAAKYLVSCGLKGVGTDAPGVDPMAGPYDAHRTLLSGGLVILENLRLQRVIGRQDLMLFALPLKWARADGAPVRAVAEFREFPEEDGGESL